MTKIIDLIGKKFGKLMVIERANDYISPKGKHLVKWLCHCECGNNLITNGANLKRGFTRSCGCLPKSFSDLVGQRFGRLAVLEFDHKEKHGYWWKCVCDCGNFKVIRGMNLKTGATQSCGCYHKQRCSESASKGGDIASFNSLYLRYKLGAKNRELIFSLDKTFFREITGKPCYYCGCVPAQELKTVSLNRNYIYNGVDRLDNKLGYVEDNIVPCCGICNHAKKTMSRQEFLDWVERVHNHQQERITKE